MYDLLISLSNRYIVSKWLNTMTNSLHQQAAKILVIVILETKSDVKSPYMSWQQKWGKTLVQFSTTILVLQMYRYNHIKSTGIFPCTSTGSRDNGAKVWRVLHFVTAGSAYSFYLY